ncbi:MAG: ATP-binding protein [Leptothrix sp. (in: b-proteobacteria)]
MPEAGARASAVRPAGHSLQGRLVALALGVVTLLWLVAGTLAWRESERELADLLDGHLAQAAALLMSQQSHELDEDELDAAPALHRYAPRVAYQVWHDGALLLRTSSAPQAPMSSLVRGFESRRIGDDDWRVFAAQATHGGLQIFVGERLDARAGILGAVIRNVFAPLAIVLPLLALALWWAVRVGLRPLRSLSTLLHARQPGAIGAVQLPTTFTEMQPLLDALNGLFTRIGELLDHERRFNADAAHELNTPIAAIRAQAQVALREGDDALRRHALQATLAGCDRASHLVAQMLQLARIEGGQADAPRERIDLGALSRQVVADHVMTARGRGQRLELDAPDTCPVQGDPLLLATLMRNLIDNALRYSPAQAQIRVRVDAAHDGQPARWSIDDSGPGLTDADLQRLGERFFRVLGNDAPGSGLGWSIVRRVARALELAVSVQRSPTLGGLRVQIDWPAPKG